MSETTLARLTCDEATARRLADSLSERFDEAATAAFEGTDGRWNLEIHFESPPDQDQVRLTLSQIAGADSAARLTFEQIATKDWVAASLAELKPVEAGRFTVHGAHDRARVAPNRIGIEIEAALAFGTGHHGTTRGCLLALDWIAKTQRPRRVLDIGTGTGVLAIAAAKAFRRPVLASDIDPEAVAIARDQCTPQRRLTARAMYLRQGIGRTQVSPSRPVRSGVRQYPAAAAQGACQAYAAAPCTRRARGAVGTARRAGELPRLRLTGRTG